MTFLDPMPVLSIWLHPREKIKLKYLPAFIIRSDPIWKTVQVTVVAMMATAQAVAEAEGSAARAGLVAQGRSGRRQ
jgi:hypothetical protein